MTLLNEINNFYIEFPFLIPVTEFINDFILDIVPLISLILFPFYVIVNRRNKKRDEKTPIFFITDYFFKVTCFTELVTTLLLVAALVLRMLVFTKRIPMETLIMFSPAVGIWLVAKAIVTLVINVLITFLAIHRFLLYFFSKLGNLMTPSKKIAKFLIFVLHIAATTAVLQAGSTSSLPEEEQKIMAEQYQIYQLITNFIMLLCSLPYLLMILSIRKLTSLTSNIQSRPEQYIKYQIVIIFISKIIMLPFWISVQATVAMNKQESPAPAFMMQLVCESMISPLMIQLAYLLSNKTNWEMLKMVICCCKSNRNMLDSRVEPTETVIDSVPPTDPQNRTLARTTT